ncbi:CDP-alcohol phosphatidyltransferase family protein [Actinomadura scrupuli]|uniref:CDP-alcohol phosphatidyltransferase family protein n=1 Tax=Actinomadura scrupuli TaxID=559629 RepID=UPI003D9794BB
MPATFRRRRHPYRDVVAAGRPSDGWWTPVLLEPVAFRLVRLLADHTPATPNQVTALSAMLTVAAAGGLLEGGPLGLVAGALLLQLSLLTDRMDGTLARLTGTATELGAWFGAVAGRARLMMCGTALLAGEYARTDDRAYLFLTALVLICCAVLEITDGHAELFPAGFARRPSALRARVGRGARAVRIARPRPLTWPVTEAEYGLAVCVLAPQTGAYVPMIVAASGLLLCGELAGLGAAVRSSRRARPARRPPTVTRSPYGAADWPEAGA